MRWQADGHFFLWITDDKGWLTTLKPLRDAFNKIDILLNLDMIQNGLMVDYICVCGINDEINFANLHSHDEFMSDLKK